MLPKSKKSKEKTIILVLMSKQLEVIASPALVHLYDLDGKNIVVIDVLRATSTICTALHAGAKSIIPVLSTDMALEYREGDYLLAAERGGEKVDGFQFGNSPREYTQDTVANKEIVLTTTNGTKCMHLSTKGKRIISGSFVNISVLEQYLTQQEEDVILFCAGWKDKFNLEDFLFAGALAQRLSKNFSLNCDAAEAAIDLYKSVENNIEDYILKASHAQRFKNLGITEDIQLCFKKDSAPVIPLLSNGKITKVPIESKS